MLGLRSLGSSQGILVPSFSDDLSMPFLLETNILYFLSVYICRLDYQVRPHVREPSALRNLVVKLPPRVHSIYYRDEIGNISTSNVWSDSAKVGIDSL